MPVREAMNNSANVLIFRGIGMTWEASKRVAEQSRLATVVSGLHFCAAIG